jgi:hypothetical protein
LLRKKLKDRTDGQTNIFTCESRQKERPTDRHKNIPPQK